MLDARLNGLALMYIHKTKLLSSTDVINVFAQKKIEKLNFLSKFLV